MTNGFLSEFLQPFLGKMLGRLPVFLVYLAGVGLALRRRKSHPRVARLTCLAVGALALHDLANFALLVSLPGFLARQRLDEDDITLSLNVVGLVQTFVYAGIIGLFLWAIFTQRPTEQPLSDTVEELPAFPDHTKPALADRLRAKP